MGGRVPTRVLLVGGRERYLRYLPTDVPVTMESEKVFVARDASEDEVVERGRGCEFMSVDAIVPVRASVIDALADAGLRLIHSEGVAYNAIDVEAAAQRGIPVCNCKGANASAVAEQTVMLMLAALRDAAFCDAAVRDGRQMQVKEQMMLRGYRELADCRVGLVGLGDIGTQVARHLQPFGCEVAYWSRHRRDEGTERELGVRYLPLDELLAQSDIVSLHVAVTDQTRGMAGERFLSLMPEGSILVNTARGELVDNHALAAALESGHLAGAGIDTLAPEPVTCDNPVLRLSPQAMRHVVLSPHIGGNSAGCFRRAHRMVWEGFQDVLDGRRPQFVVNGV